EAAQLVIQAGAMGRGGDVFLLDMGAPVKIMQLAVQMIHLSGHTVRSPENTTGDIEITFTGLRPGEKLYEELVIGGEVTGTQHPLIMRVKEAAAGWPETLAHVRELETLCQAGDTPNIIALLAQTVEGYVP